MLKPSASPKKIIVGVIGFTVLLVGIALLVLPGPAFVVIPVGLAILASEFAWARRILKKVKKEIKNKKDGNNLDKDKP